MKQSQKEITSELNKIIFNNAPDLSLAISMMNTYSTLEANNLLNNNKTISKTFALLHFIFNFSKWFIFKGEILRGIRGFIFSIAQSYTAFLTHLKLLKLRNIL